jgi:hypothetical protein
MLLLQDVAQLLVLLVGVGSWADAGKKMETVCNAVQVLQALL